MGALMELIVINVGYDFGVISQQMFTILVIMAIFSTVITSPLLRRWLPLIGIPIPVNSIPGPRSPYQQQGNSVWWICIPICSGVHIQPDSRTAGIPIINRTIAD